MKKPVRRKIQKKSKLGDDIAEKLSGAKKVAILGVGSELRSDDAAGVLAAQAIEKTEKCDSRIKVFIGGTAPENLTGQIKNYGPTHLVIIDTADIGGNPGDVKILTSDEIGGISFSTHRLPTSIMVDYLQSEIRCAVYIIGIQPKSITFGGKVSKEVTRAVELLSEAIVKALS